MGGVDFQDCFLCWLVSPECRRVLGARHPVSGRLGVYLFPPSGLRPSRGWNDCCVKEILRIAPLRIPSLQIIDFAGDLGLVESARPHEESGADVVASESDSESATTPAKVSVGGPQG